MSDTCVLCNGQGFILCHDAEGEWKRVCPICHKEDEEEAIGDLVQRIAELEAEISRLRERFTAPIVCMCGSTRFKQAWITENARLTGEGNIVLAVGLWGHHERMYPDDATKVALDDLHKRKIDLCDWVYVLDVGGYIGESTRSEIAYAEKLGKPIVYLSVLFPDYAEPADPLQVENAKLRERLAMARIIIIGDYMLQRESYLNGKTTWRFAVMDYLNPCGKPIERGSLSGDFHTLDAAFAAFAAWEESEGK